MQTEKIQSLFARYSIVLYLTIVLVQASFQFFINSEDWRYAGIAGTDGQAYYAFVRSIFIDGDLDFENEFYEYNYNRHGFQTPDFFPRSPITGLYFNRFPIGFSVFMLPFFLMAHLLTWLGNAVGIWDLKPDGYTILYQLAAPVNTIFYAALAYWTMQCILRRWFSPLVSAFTVFVLFLSYQGSFNVIQFWCNPHLQSFLMFNVMVLMAFRIKDGRGGYGAWAVMGAAAGALGLLRTECLIFLLFPFLIYCHRLYILWKEEPQNRFAAIRRLSSKALLTPLVAWFVFLPQLIVWRLMMGEWFQIAMNNSAEGFNWTHPAWWQVLFSTRHGLFYWSPILLVGFVGYLWFVFHRKNTLILVLALIQLAAVYYLYASWKIWWMGYSFGARQFIVVTPIFGIGLGYIVHKCRRRWPWLMAGAFLFIGWNMAMLWMFLNAHIPRTAGFHFFLPLEKFWQLVKETVT
ncbi:MAG: hypothetical protein ACLFQ6_01705 [Candidatus Sumerlaeia bacterium]